MKCKYCAFPEMERASSLFGSRGWWEYDVCPNCEKRSRFKKVMK